MENKKNGRFIKAGDVVIFKSNTEGLDYNLEKNTVYTIEIDRYTDSISLKINSELSLPTKIYNTTENNKFIKKVLNHEKISTDGVTGVMLSGLKGSGKTVMMKQIASESNLPIILVDKGFRPSMLKKLFSLLQETECCFVFDEIDKLGEDYDDTYLLQVLDGAATAGKHLAVFTCNDESEINDCLKDRCSRIHYWKRFGEMPNSMILSILKDNLKDAKKIAETAQFIQKNFAVISFDNVVSFVNEINNYPEESLDELFNDMNLSKRR